MDNETPYSELTPELVIDAIESVGYITDLRISPLNSYENRVYQVGIENDEPLIAKFYRPGRWTDQQILEEHQFSYELFDIEIPVVPPLQLSQSETLFTYKNFRFSMYERRGGRAPELDNLDSLHMLGRLAGRIHSVGAKSKFTERPSLNIKTFAEDSFTFISENFIPSELHLPYTTLCKDLIARLKVIFTVTQPTLIRTHGDCHSGNILWRDDTPHFVDLDDSRMAPAIQDLWMFISGDRQLQTSHINEIVEGYNEFYNFDPKELQLIEAMRTLRIMHYSAWLAKRWNDPAFPHNFPWFNTERYWANHILELREQLALLNEPPLKLF